jgi:hypothetical protein
MNNNKQKPFFAAFLENQVDEAQAQKAQGGDPYVTLKYPSDADEHITLKYPSDQEDNPTTKATDLYQTMKYPSDNDESGTGV